MEVIENEDNLIFFSIAYIQYDIKDIKLVSKPSISPTEMQNKPWPNCCDIPKVIYKTLNAGATAIYLYF
jgi:hypothetical protein